MTAAEDVLLVKVHDLIERALAANERADTPLAADSLASGLAVSVVALLRTSDEDTVRVPREAVERLRKACAHAARADFAYNSVPPTNLGLALAVPVRDILLILGDIR